MLMIKLSQFSAAFSAAFLAGSSIVSITLNPAAS
jgi:hypothetical protein